MKFTNWKEDLEAEGYVVTDDLITTARGDVLAGKDPYGGYFIMDARIQYIVSQEPTKTVTKTVRARTKEGQFIADDPSTPDVNEAWVSKTIKKVVKKK